MGKLIGFEGFGDFLASVEKPYFSTETAPRYFASALLMNDRGPRGFFLSNLLLLVGFLCKIISFYTQIIRKLTTEPLNAERLLKAGVSRRRDKGR